MTDLIAGLDLGTSGVKLAAVAPDAPEETAEALTVVVVTPYLGIATTKEVIEIFEEKGAGEGWDVSVVDTAGGILVNVTSDNEDLGQQSAQALIDEMGGTGEIVMMTHDPHPGVCARAEGAWAVFAEAGIAILEEKHVEVPGPVDNARSQVQHLISAQGDQVTGIWGGWDEPARGATQALDAAGVTDIPVVGVDGQDFAIAEIDKSGPFTATVKQDWDAIATEIVALIGAYVTEDTEPAEQQIESPGQLVTAE